MEGTPLMNMEPLLQSWRGISWFGQGQPRQCISACSCQVWSPALFSAARSLCGRGSGLGNLGRRVGRPRIQGTDVFAGIHARLQRHSLHRHTDGTMKQIAECIIVALFTVVAFAVTYHSYCGG